MEGIQAKARVLGAQTVGACVGGATETGGTGFARSRHGSQGAAVRADLPWSRVGGSMSWGVAGRGEIRTQMWQPGSCCPPSCAA